MNYVCKRCHRNSTRDAKTISHAGDGSRTYWRLAKVLATLTQHYYYSNADGLKYWHDIQNTHRNRRPFIRNGISVAHGLMTPSKCGPKDRNRAPGESSAEGACLLCIYAEFLSTSSPLGTFFSFPTLIGNRTVSAITQYFFVRNSNSATFFQPIKWILRTDIVYHFTVNFQCEMRFASTSIHFEREQRISKRKWARKRIVPTDKQQIKCRIVYRRWERVEKIRKEIINFQCETYGCVAIHHRATSTIKWRKKGKRRREKAEWMHRM